MAAVCVCVARHSPKPRELNLHHAVPQSWGGKTEPANLVTLCPSSHSNVHALLNAYVHAGGLPAPSVLRKFNQFTQDLAAYAWERRPNDKPPYTTQHGAVT